jgi:hypothetical protein
MPSWKKVIISGSNAALNSLTVTNGITGSLFGTASFATSASFLTSNTNAFIQNGNSFGTTALLGTNDNQSLALETSGSTRMFISSSGNVGIGTTSPVSRLQSNNASTYNNSTPNGAIIVSNLAGGNAIVDIGVDTSLLGYIQSRNITSTTTYNLLLNPLGGNVGIGTTTPGNLLSVAGAVSASVFNANSVVLTTRNFKADLYGYTGPTLSYYDGVSIVPALTVFDNGNVGIGTSSPSERLTVSGSLNINSEGSYIGADYQAVPRLGFVKLPGAQPFLGFAQSSFDLKVSSGTTIATSNTFSSVLTAKTTGEVGIGKTTPNAKLDVSGSAIISGSFTVIPGTVREFQVNTTGVDIGNLITDTHTVTGSLSVSGSVSILSSILQYSNNAAITSGSTANVASFNTSSYTAAFFDYVTTSGTNARAGTVFTVWNGTNVEYAETSTNDIGNTFNLVLSASVSAGVIRLQATSLSGSWSVKTLARMI